MQKLGYTIPTYSVSRQLQVTLDTGKKQVEIMGIDTNKASYTICKKMTVTGLGKNAGDVTDIDHEKKFQPYRVPITNSKSLDSFVVDMDFFSHYNEQGMKLTVPMDILADKKTLVFHMDYSLRTRKWASVIIKDAEGNPLTEAQYK